MIDTTVIKDIILKLALRGKLTGQLNCGGTAEELFEQIQSEKCSFTEGGKIKKRKTLLPVLENEMPFDIPHNWKWVRIGDVFTLKAGKNITASAISEECDKEHKYCCYGGNGIRGYVSDYNVSGEHVIVGRQGALCGNINMASGNFYATEHAVVVYQYAYTNVRWVGLALKALNLNQYATSVAQPGIAVSRIEKVLLPLPPVEEQNRIVEIVSKVFDAFDKIDELQSSYSANIEVLKTKLINAGIQGKLTEQLSEDGDVEVLYERLKEEKKLILKNRKGREDNNIKGVEDDIPYELPSHWKWVRLGEIGLLKKGPFGSALTKSMFIPKSEETVKVYEQQHAIQKDASLGTYYISREYFDEKMSGFEVESGDIIVSCAGTIGETYILPEGIEQGIINQALMRVVLVDSVDKKFFQYYFDANLKKMAQNESNGSAIKNIPPFDVMKNWYFPLTSLEEQRRIVEKLNQLLKFI